MVRPQHAARYNIAPTQTVPFVHHDKDGQQVLREGRWWLVPHWATEFPKATAITALADNLALKHQATDHLEGVIARLKAGKS